MTENWWTDITWQCIFASSLKLLFLKSRHIHTHTHIHLHIHVQVEEFDMLFWTLKRKVKTEKDKEKVLFYKKIIIALMFTTPSQERLAHSECEKRGWWLGEGKENKQNKIL